jgi:hypothetical protein
VVLFLCGVYCPGFCPPARLDLLHVKRSGGKLEVPLGWGGTVLSGPAVRFWHGERGFQMHGDLSGEGEECCDSMCMFRSVVILCVRRGGESFFVRETGEGEFLKRLKARG